MATKKQGGPGTRGKLLELLDAPEAANEGGALVGQALVARAAFEAEVAAIAPAPPAPPRARRQRRRTIAPGTSAQDIAGAREAAQRAGMLARR